MNNNLTAEDKLKIINLIAQVQTKQELKTSLEDYLTETMVPEKELSLPIEEELPPTEEPLLKSESRQVETPSIYSQKYRELVNLDKQNHPRENVKLSSEVPEGNSAIKSTAPTVGLSEENPPKNEPKVLERTTNNPWAASGARTVAPGELNLN